MESNKEFKSYALLIMDVLVLIVSITQSFQISKLKESLEQGLGGKTTGGVDMSSWTENEKMMYEHHGTLPSGVQGSGQSQGGMVGGC